MGYVKASGELLECQLCPRLCRLAPGQSGECRIRINVDGKLLAVTHGFPCSVHIDPIEKKPLFHFLPGSPIFSVATVGCNLHCKNCQNWQISQANPEEVDAHDLPPDKLVEKAASRGCESIAYTYTEPLVYYEYTLHSSEIARERGLNNVLVTAGYINQEPLERLLKVTDAANVDLKAFDDGFYRHNCGGTLAPVLATLVTMKQMGVWVEVTNLLIPTLNDDMKLIARMTRWMVENLGKETPLHISRFHPRYQLTNLPITPESTLVQARETALEAGLDHVYMGNVPGSGGEVTFCPDDGTRLIERVGYTVEANHLVEGKCPTCGRELMGVFR